MLRLRCIVASAVSALLLLGCSSKRAELLEEIDGLKKQLPMSMGALGQLSDVGYDDADDCVVYTIDLAPGNSFVSDSLTRSLRDNLVSFASAPQNKEMVRMFVESNSGMMFRYIDKAASDTLSVSLSCGDLARALENPITDGEYYENYLRESVRSVKSMLPRTVDFATTLSDVTLTDSALVFDYRISCVEQGFFAFKSDLASDEFKAELIGKLQDPSLSELLKSLVMTGREYVSVYTDEVDPSQVIRVELTRPELAAAMVAPAKH